MIYISYFYCVCPGKTLTDETQNGSTDPDKECLTILGGPWDDTR